MFFIAGLTGKVGGAAATRMLEQGHGVRGLVRDPGRAIAWAERGVEVRRGDLNNASDVAAALEDVEGAFLLIPPLLAPSAGYPEARAVIASYLEALDRTPPPRLALLSSIGSEKTSGLGNITTTHLMEEALGDLRFPTAVVRAGGFLENFIGGLASAAATGVCYSFYQPTDRALPMIATKDIGHEIARLLVEGWKGKTIVELGSPISPDDIARAMGEAVGRPVVAQTIPRERWAASLAAFGMAPGTTGPYEEMLDAFNSGWIDFGAEGAVRVPGTTTPTEVFSQARSVARPVSIDQ